jgi:uncharacterized protein YgiB involved in biofilm formation
MARRSSSSIRLGAYASPALNGTLLAAAAVTLAGCDAEPTYVPETTAAYQQTLSGGDSEPAAEVVAFKTVDECVAADNDRAVCQAALDDAKTGAGDFAPRYESLADCEKDFDDCRQAGPQAATSAAPSSGGSFQPFLNGFLIARALDGFGDRSGRSSYAPIFRTRDGSLVNGGGYGVPSYGTAFNAGRNATSGLTSRPMTIQRFGLGQSQTATRGVVPGSSSDVVKSFRTSPSYQAARTSEGFRSASTTSFRSASPSISRGGFGSAGRGGFGG